MNNYYAKYLIVGESILIVPVELDHSVSSLIQTPTMCTHDIFTAYIVPKNK